MVKVAILIISFTTIIVANAQNICDTCNIIFGEPQELPEIKDINKFINENLRYPESAKKDRIEGKIFVSFWIDTLGYTSEHKITKGIRPDLDEEALRVARLIKFDKPAINRGKPIGICFQLPITFRLTHIGNSQLNKATNRRR
ncbi:MAG: energy transducer TonB [Proteiniphilum sp.]|uniref:energy transducer TonB n=1 Tax=Proteiniphilum sp. TaxID=1926877 RepID=UPI002ABA21F3|nr:energy transducer TonB [Proteiniphilum sp.]MDY9919534.1 energy transducer TonB [Proteiniphilum sp.]